MEISVNSDLVLTKKMSWDIQTYLNMFRQQYDVDLSGNKLRDHSGICFHEKKG